ncbi:DUF305 domain-containing protein [Nocardia puris]|uniref:DUF305 domain-containing protein n=1 Tax=Nocardia puris TaxID=208602 RepID=UPI001893159D|nr:DUF305 domain-containing protein [Nocardia puris]MBF6210379.1 DUF305 domain-containing protein [Nocardia puris]MBF6367454.1 DUF305 domain-containing protein [Nocardia puris]MBF6457639.1 DUF305 domain-containing protein [Nocardia puris]
MSDIPASEAPGHSGAEHPPARVHRDEPASAEQADRDGESRNTKSPNWIASRPLRLAAYASLALTLLVLGAALRPLFLPEKHSAAPVLTAVETGFAQDMTAHHQQALFMTQRLDPAANPTVRRLADQLADTQRLEIGTMLGWLRLAGASPLSPNPMAWMGAAHHHAEAPQAAMPGMATQAELDELAAARGRDAEVLFLRLMIRHHQGGVEMARAVDAMLEGGPVKELARSMVQTQGQEIGVMIVLLTELGGAPL